MMRDITATHEGRGRLLETYCARRRSSLVPSPLAAAAARQTMQRQSSTRAADKISIGLAAIARRRACIGKIGMRSFGAQAVIVAIDATARREGRGRRRGVRQRRAQATGLARRRAGRAKGRIARRRRNLRTSMDTDGMRGRLRLRVYRGGQRGGADTRDRTAAARGWAAHFADVFWARQGRRSAGRQHFHLASPARVI